MEQPGQPRWGMPLGSRSESGGLGGGQDPAGSFMIQMLIRQAAKEALVQVDSCNRIRRCYEKLFQFEECTESATLSILRGVANRVAPHES